MGNFKVSIPV